VSKSDYPLLTVPGYELYQLAHLTSFAVDALVRRRRAAGARDRLAHQARATNETSADAAADRSTPITRFPGGFPAAAAALPGPRIQPSSDSTAKGCYSNAVAPRGRPADARSALPPRQGLAP
jgi:hypothetical protein